MRTALEILDSQFLEMRWRCLSLAADLDRMQNAAGGAALFETDPRLKDFSRALAILAQLTPNRAEKVQMLFSDTSGR